jgi:hypothetical protein
LKFSQRWLWRAVSSEAQRATRHYIPGDRRLSENIDFPHFWIQAWGVGQLY